MCSVLLFDGKVNNIFAKGIEENGFFGQFNKKIRKKIVCFGFLSYICTDFKHIIQKSAYVYTKI